MIFVPDCGIICPVPFCLVVSEPALVVVDSNRSDGKNVAAVTQCAASIEWPSLVHSTSIPHISTSMPTPNSHRNLVKKVYRKVTAAYDFPQSPLP